MILLTDIPWPSPPKQVGLAGDEVHVWVAVLDSPGLPFQSLERSLSSDELRRADRFHFEKDHRHYVVSRALLRVILGRYLDLEPSQIRFEHNPHGKPFLARELHGDTPRFKVSHSHGIALYAVTYSREIGIDIERIRKHADRETIAERFFSAQEAAMIRAVSEDLRDRAFFACWTRREAYLKVRGEGLSPSRGTEEFDVDHSALPWSFVEITSIPGYVAAVAAEGHDWRLKCWRWPE